MPDISIGIHSDSWKSMFNGGHPVPFSASHRPLWPSVPALHAHASWCVNIQATIEYKPATYLNICFFIFLSAPSALSEGDQGVPNACRKDFLDILCLRHWELTRHSQRRGRVHGAQNRGEVTRYGGEISRQNMS